MNEMYEELTVPELRNLAEESGIEIPADARKADIIKALEAGSKAAGKKESKEGENVYNFLMTSTTGAQITHDDFWRLKLIS
jgi:hypothetical protein